jgi:hypothetical protein
MSDFTAAVAAKLASLGLVGGASGWTLQQLGDASPASQVVTVRPTGGPEPEHATDRIWLSPTCQVEVRAGTPKLASDKADTILAALNGADVTGFGFVRATQSSPLPTGVDTGMSGERHHFAVDFRAGEA